MNSYTASVIWNEAGCRTGQGGMWTLLVEGPSGGCCYAIMGRILSPDGKDLSSKVLRIARVHDASDAQLLTAATVAANFHHLTIATFTVARDRFIDRAGKKVQHFA